MDASRSNTLIDQRGLAIWHTRITRLFLAVIFPFTLSAQDQGSILQRRITIDAENVRMQTALSLMAKDGGFKLSYNAAVVPSDSIVTVRAENEKVDPVLKRTLPDGLNWKESGNHLIITGTRTRKQRFTATGSVFDALDGSPITSASVVEVKRNNAVVTASNGGFEIALAGDLESTPLLFSRRGYRDTVIFVPRNADIGPVKLKPLEQVDRLEPICLQDRCGVEDLGVARLLVPSSQRQQAFNLDYTEKSDWQVSLIPSVSTNGPISGSVVNRFSFNVIGGYARGLEGFELAGALHMLSNDMHGLQIAGATNLVGGHIRGVQIAGGVNHAMRTSEGLQLAGGANVVWDTLAGVQVAGGVNIVKRVMTGTQISGGTNIALQDLNGVQVAGGLNITHGVVNKTQIAGGMNYARSVKGAQIAGGFNLSLGDVGGGQVSGGVNYAHNVKGGQVAGGLNVVSGKVEGGQVGVINYGTKVSGGQIGILNFSDSLSGSAIGFFTFSLKGYHRFDVITGDVMPLSLQFRTGTRVFHNILGYSAPVTTDERWGFLYGIGTEPRFGKHLLMNIDLTAEQVVEQREWVDAVNILGRLNVSFGYMFADQVVISAGPVVNMLGSDWRDAETDMYLSDLPPAEPLLEWRRENDLRISGWLGWRVGLGVQF